MSLPNPALPGFHPDPSICRVGEDYYLACSSFEYLPGIPLFHSRDLRRWQPIGHVVDRAEQLSLTDVPTLGGAWAPTIRHHEGRWWVVVTDAMGRGSLVFSATDPAGPWSDGTVLDGVDGIDPDLAWDQDGTCFVTYSGLILGGPEAGRHLGIQQVRIDLDTGKALEPPRSLWSGTGLMFPEAPHLYQVDGRWYLMIAEGGTERGHSVSIARGDRPDGPFTGAPANPILSARSTDRPIQNTGHGDLVQLVDGTWAMVLLGMRPRGLTRSFSALGRESFVTGVRWVDGWPEADPVLLGEPAPAVLARDDFDAAGLGMDWISVRRPASAFSSLADRPGWLVLGADGATLDDLRPVFVGRRQEHEDSTCSALIDAAAGVGGLSVRMDERHHYDIEVGEGAVRARVRIDQVTQTWQRPAPAGPVVLWIRTISTAGTPVAGLDGLGPDVVQLGFDAPDGPVEVARMDGRYLSAETCASFTGRVTGLYATSGTVAADWFQYAGQDGPR